VGLFALGPRSVGLRGLFYATTEVVGFTRGSACEATRFLTYQVVEDLAMRALDLEPHPWTECKLFDLLKQTAAAETPHLLPPYFACDINSGRWEGGHRCVSENESGYEIRNLLLTRRKVKNKHAKNLSAAARRT
jgi:hypothetical protein